MSINLNDIRAKAQAAVDLGVEANPLLDVVVHPGTVVVMVDEIRQLYRRVKRAECSCPSTPPSKREKAFCAACGKATRYA